MVVFRYDGELEWGALDVPVLGLGCDWHGDPVDPPAMWSLVQDRGRLWFLAGRRKPAAPHPRSRPGMFRAELWKHDVAELFLRNPVTGRYLEVNLSPNGAWWTCEFTAPRVRAEEMDIEMPDVATFAEMSADGSWMAAVALPLDVLAARLDYGAATQANVTMILDSPEQRFLTVNPGEGEPDFHQEKLFTTLRPMDPPAAE